MYRLLGILLTVWVTSGHAQPATVLGLEPKVGGSAPPAKAIFMVGEGGKITSAANGVGVQFQAERLSQAETVSAFLKRNWLAEDDKTKTMLRALNPSYDTSSGVLPAGAKINFFAPKFPLSIKGGKFEALYTFDTPNPTKLVFREQLQRTSNMSATAYKLSVSPGAFQNPSVAKSYFDATAELAKATRTLEQRGDTATPMELALAQYQIEFALSEATWVNERAYKAGRVSQAEVQAIKVSTDAARDTAQRIATGRGVPVRQVTVTVLKRQSSQHERQLQVYVLPSAVFTKAQFLTLGDVQAWLTHFSFIEEASPATQAMPVMDARICVGPRFRFLEVAKLALSGKLTKCKPIDDPALNSPSVAVRFYAPDDLLDVR